VGLKRIADQVTRFVMTRLLRERELILRSQTGVRYVVLSTRLQGSVASAGLVALICATWIVIGHQTAWRLVDQKRQEVARVEEAYRLAIDSLGAAVEGATEVGRAESASAILSLVAQNEALQKHLGEVEQKLANADAERERASSAHEALIERLRKIDLQVRGMASRSPDSNTVLSSVEQSVVDAMAERGRLAVERDRLAVERSALKAELQELEKRQGTLTTTHEATISQLSERTQAGIEGLKRLIGRTGLDAEKLLGTRGQSGVGGPFVPSMPSVGNTGDKLQAGLVGLGSQIGRLEDMRRLLRALPVGAPLEDYALRSPFGVRRDPFNGQLAMHTGVDLSSPIRTPVLATAAGIVVNASWNGEFGNLVEINHGYGITTRYGHLSRIYVKVGQRVPARHVVGLVGTTGRSTGPHVHYEIMDDGKSINPTKFLEAARYVSKAQ
jgi:murein DD-endopeptidase MepM/ murein hydrolase activator NlpD